MKPRPVLPIPVKSVLEKFGSDLRDARRRRRISVSVMAERARLSRTTLDKIEKGRPGVSLGNYATVLFVLGMIDRLSEMVDSSHDRLGLELDAQRLPQRIRQPRRPKGSI